MVIVNNVVVLLRDEQVVINDVSVTFIPGIINVIIGSSGAGKTTLLQSLAGLIPIASGSISIDGREISDLLPAQRAQYVGYVFQDFNLFSHFTVLENCVDPMLVHGIILSEAQSRALQMLQELGLGDYIDRYPSQLSGGQKQRVAIARALCLNSQVLLLDEPTASLDPENTDILVKILKSYAQKGLTIVLSSQDMSFTNKLFDRVFYMQAGCIVETGDRATNLEECSKIKQWLNLSN
jgi:ABC-type polar amino acid transport system ATPase subunit